MYGRGVWCLFDIDCIDLTTLIATYGVFKGIT